jgi:hypothetical protein
MIFFFGARVHIQNAETTNIFTSYNTIECTAFATTERAVLHLLRRVVRGAFLPRQRARLQPWSFALPHMCQKNVCKESYMFFVQKYSDERQY